MASKLLPQKTKEFLTKQQSKGSKSPSKAQSQKEVESTLQKVQEESKVASQDSVDQDEDLEASYSQNEQKDPKSVQDQLKLKLPTPDSKLFNTTICNDHHNLLQNIIDRSHQIDWDIPLKPRKKFIGHAGKPEHFCWGNGVHLTDLVSCDDMGQVIHWSARKGKKLTVYNLAVALLWVDLEPQNGKFAIAGSSTGNLFVLELNVESKGKVTKGAGRTFGIEAHKSAITTCRFLNSNIVVTGSYDKSLCIWDLDDRTGLVSRHTCHDGSLTSIDVCEDDPNIILTSSVDKSCKIWDVRIKSPVQHEYKKHLGAVNDVEFMPGMISSFASGGDDGSVRLFDLRVVKELAIFIDKPNHHAINSISFSPSGRIVVAATEDKRVKAWDTLYDADPFQYFDYGFQAPIQWTKLSKDGFTMGVLGKDGVLGIAY